MAVAEDLCPDDSLFIAQASLAAQAHVQTWIQATLREVALQTLLQCCSVQDESTYQIHDNAVMKAQVACQIVAVRWKDRLVDMGYRNAGLWIDQVVEAGCGSLFHNSPAGATQQSSLAGNLNQDPLINTEPSSLAEGSVTTLGRLWSLKCLEPDDPDDEPDPASVIEKLDAWGRAGHTDWPHNWNIVGKLVKDIPRVFITKKKNSSDDMEDSVSEEDEERKRHKERALLQKRKNRQGEDRPKPAPKVPKEIPDEIPRPPYDAPPVLKIPERWTKEEQEELDSYVQCHDDLPSLVIVGALQDLGQYYCHRQKAEADLEGKSLKQQRTWQRDRVRERLAGHKPVGHRELAGHRPTKSRVLHCQQEGDFFMDFDMSHCLLEWRNSPDNHVLFFSNVEVVVKDGDNSDDGDMRV